MRRPGDTNARSERDMEKKERPETLTAKDSLTKSEAMLLGPYTGRGASPKRGRKEGNPRFYDWYSRATRNVLFKVPKHWRQLS